MLRTQEKEILELFYCCLKALKVKSKLVVCGTRVFCLYVDVCVWFCGFADCVLYCLAMNFTHSCHQKSFPALLRLRD